MLFTIGTSNRTPAEFFDELDRRNVWLLVDVRSRPYSRNPWACGGALQIAAVEHGLRYAWSGAILGGLNDIPTTDRAFELVADTLVDALDHGPVAIFCAEGDPARCHRSGKIGAHLLLRRHQAVANITRSGLDEPIQHTIRRTRPTDLPPCLRPGLAALGLCEGMQPSLL